MLTLRVNVLLSNNYIQSVIFLVTTPFRQLRICSCLACVYRVMDVLWLNSILGLNFIFLCFKLVIINYHTQKQNGNKI